jgi:hypothetical protein
MGKVCAKLLKHMSNKAKINHDSRIKTVPLRDLNIQSELNYLSAASGLVCANGSAYVVADDQQILARFSNTLQRGEVLELSSVKLPNDTKQRKKQKPDFETLLLKPSPNRNGGALIALGSGSASNRNCGTCVTLDQSGAWFGTPLSFDLSPLYSELRTELGDLNIEGGFITQHPTTGQAQLVLINRALANRSANAAIFFAASVLSDVIAGECNATKPLSISEFELGELDGIGLGFTDATALEDGGWLFSAAAEDRSDSYNDGRCTGSVIGRVSANNKITITKRLDKNFKVEGLAVQPSWNGQQKNNRNALLTICMVTDADDPARVSQMLIAQF